MEQRQHQRLQWGAAIGRAALALLGTAGVTWVCVSIPGVNIPTVGFAYLLLVLAVAAGWGLVEAVAASIAAVLCYNYFFLPPVGEFSIADSDNWIALFAFLVTALVASHLSDRAKQQAEEARRRQLETEQLYALSRAILLTDMAQPIGPQAAAHIARIFGAQGVLLFDAHSGGTFQGGPVELTGLDEQIRQTVLEGAARRETPNGVSIWPISLGGHSIGALAVQGLKVSDGAMQALLNLVAIAIERVRTEAAANRAEAARQSEEFKSTLLDAVAHEFKTPLTSIKAAATALLAGRERMAAAAPEAGELLAVIDEEANRLSGLVTEAVRMAQIEAGKVRLQRTKVPVEELLEQGVSAFGNRAEGRIELVPPGAPAGAPPLAIHGDRELILLALRHLIDNALKYAPPSTAVRVWADWKDGRVRIHVADQGPGVPEQDCERIFDRFFRRAPVRGRVPGSGMGLHIAREIARTHGGDVWMEPALAGREGTGAEFCLALPRFGEVAGA